MEVAGNGRMEHFTMQEKIGSVVLDYEYYPGKDLYSDGPVEEELLEIAKNYREEELNKVIAERNSWPVLYHFSHIRQNILEWAPISKRIRCWKLVPGAEPSQECLRERQGKLPVSNCRRCAVLSMHTETGIMIM